MNPKISIIIPVFQGQKYLKETLDSVVNQTFTDFEIMAIDDGSSDESLLILNNYAKQDDRLKVIHQNENRGISFSTNLGVALSKGQYIALSDQDDVSVPERLAVQSRFLDERPNIDLVGAQIIKCDSHGKLGWQSAYPLMPGAVRWGLLFGCIISNSTVLMRKEIFTKSGFKYGPAITAQDYEFFVRISNIHKMANVPETLVYIRKHQNNTSKKMFQLQQQEAFDIIRHQVIQLIDENLPDEVISGIMQAKYQKKQREIDTIKIAKEVSHILTKLMHHALTWELTDEERFYIRQNTASRLRRIWQNMDYHPLLMPNVLYSMYLDPDVISRKMKSFFSLSNKIIC